ncbi:unnamed protein product [Plutella xylostella]|uniref:(diamondback moth) hypothetical protein n=1 Tax=Plutella xylostella TaxID=51655 RepID=A0A8S4FX05_PLUXY|nr:unnamed protein product [Plutella xylostella]
MEADSFINVSMVGAGGNIIFSPSNNNTHGLTLATFALSTIGMVLSSAAIGLLLLTAILFEQWRQNYKNQLLMQFIIARFFYTSANYILDSTKLFGVNTSEGYLYYDIYLLLYTELSAVTWILVFTREMYDCLVRVLYVRGNNIVMKTSLFAWLTPAVVVSIMCVSYYFTGNYLELIFVYVFVIKLPCIVCIASLLFFINRSVLRRNRLQRTRSNIKIVIVMIFMIITFVVLQLVHDVYEVIYVLLANHNTSLHDSIKGVLVTFNIAALYQCSFSTMFWLFGNEKTRKMWKFKNGFDRESYIADRRSKISTTLTTEVTKM